MKVYLSLIVLFFATSFCHAQGLKTTNDSLSYALGQDLASYLKRMEIPINSTVLSQAIKDVLDGKSLAFTESQKEEVIRSGMERVTKEKNDKLIKASADFLQRNKQVAGVKETPEGIQYQVIKAGNGPQPSLEDTITVHYKGMLTDGTTFDSSYDRGEPIEITLNEMIEGWKIAVPLMKEGAKYKFFIPHKLGYGERASGPIPAYSTLVFEVELLKVKKVAANETKQTL